MEIQKRIAIVLQSKIYKDNDRILTLLSSDGVFVSKIVGVSKPKSKLAFASQPFCLGEFLYAQKNGYNTIIGCTQIDSFYGVMQNFDKFSVASSVLEIAKILAKENENCENLFVLILSVLKNLAYENTNANLLFIKFIMEALTIAGFGLNFETCTKCGKRIEGSAFLSLSSGGAVCHGCVDEFSKSVSKNIFDILKYCQTHSFENLTNYYAKENILNETKKIAIMCFEHLIEEEIKSQRL